MSDDGCLSEGDAPGSPEVPNVASETSVVLLSGDSDCDTLGDEQEFTTPPHTTAYTRRKSGRSALHNIENSGVPLVEIPDHNISSVTQMLKETNRLILQLSQRIDKLDEKISGIECKVNTPVSSPLSTPSRKKIIPMEVRRETRRVYAMLLEEDEEFGGWQIAPGFTYKSPENQKILSRLVNEVKGLNSSIITQHIRDAAYRYYRSHCEDKSASRRGLAVLNQKRKRRYERIARKVTERTSALKRMKFKKTSDVDVWQKVLVNDLMSSEDSSMDEDDEVLKIHSLPWRASKVTKMFQHLDLEAAKSKTPQSKRQRKRRVDGGSSLRLQPSTPNLPSWIFSA